MENYVKTFTRHITIFLMACFPVGLAFADAGQDENDVRAVEVLNNMSAQLASMDQWVVTGEVYLDAELDNGQIISTPSEVKMTVDRPESLAVSSSDGVNTKRIVINNGRFTLYRSDHNYFAHAQVPGAIDQATQTALERLDVETPLMDLISANVALPSPCAICGVTSTR
jgi:hypothetical protein